MCRREVKAPACAVTDSCSRTYRITWNKTRYKEFFPVVKSSFAPVDHSSDLDLQLTTVSLIRVVATVVMAITALSTVDAPPVGTAEL